MKGPATWSDQEQFYELEADVEDAVVTWARRRDWYVRKFKHPGRRSAPDRLFIRNGRVLFIEFKRLGNVPSEAQWIEIHDLEDAGADVIWLDSIDDAKACLLQRERS